MAQHLLTRLDAHIPRSLQYDKHQAKHFKSPQATEDFFNAMFGENISDKYAEYFVSVLTDIHKFISENQPTKIQHMTMREFSTEIIHLVICTEPRHRCVCLRYILVRPVAERMSLFKIVLYYLAFLCKNYNYNLAVRKPLPRTQELMRRVSRDWLTLKEPDATRKHTRKIFYLLNSDKINLESFGNMEGKLKIDDKSKNVTTVIFPAHTDMNDPIFVDRRIDEQLGIAAPPLRFIRFQMRLDVGDMNIVCHRWLDRDKLFILIDGVRYYADVGNLKDQETLNEMCWVCKLSENSASFKTVSDGSTTTDGINFEASKCSVFPGIEIETGRQEKDDTELLDIKTMIRSDIEFNVSDVDFCGRKFEFLDLTFETLVDFIKRVSQINAHPIEHVSTEETQLAFKIDNTNYSVADNMEMTITDGDVRVFQLTSVINFQYWLSGHFNKNSLTGRFKAMDVFKTVWPRIARYSDTDDDDVSILTADRRTPIYRFKPRLKEPITEDVSMYYNPATFNLFIRTIGMDKKSSKRYSPINLRKLRIHRQEPYSFFWDLNDMNNISLITHKGKRLSPNVCEISGKFEFENSATFKAQHELPSFFYDIALTVSRIEYILIYIDKDGIEYLPNTLSFADLKILLEEESDRFITLDISIKWSDEQVTFTQSPNTYTINSDLSWYTNHRLSGHLHMVSDIRTFLKHCFQIEPVGKYNLHGQLCNELW